MEFDLMRSSIDNEALQCSVGLIQMRRDTVNSDLPSGKERLADDNHSLASHVGLEPKASITPLKQLEVITAIPTFLQSRNGLGEKNPIPQIGAPERGKQVAAVHTRAVVDRPRAWECFRIAVNIQPRTSMKD